MMAAAVFALADADIAQLGSHAHAVFAWADGQAAVLVAMPLSCLAVSDRLVVVAACTLHLHTMQHWLHC